jgi:hypothetical protein
MEWLDRSHHITDRLPFLDDNVPARRLVGSPPAPLHRHQDCGTEAVPRQGRRSQSMCHTTCMPERHLGAVPQMQACV